MKYDFLLDWTISYKILNFNMQMINLILVLLDLNECIRIKFTLIQIYNIIPNNF